MTSAPQEDTHVMRKLLLATLLCAGVASATAVAALSPVTPVPELAAQARAVHYIYRTDGDGAWLHSVPRVQDGLLVVLPEGSEFIVECWELGEGVNGNPVWLRGSSSLGSGYVTDYYIDTRWNTTADLTNQGIPPCSSSPTAGISLAPAVSSTAPSPEVNLRGEQSARGRALQRLESTLEESARLAGVHGQTLARIVYHEGGNFLSIRRDAWSVVEFSFPPTRSVGIAGIKPSTARSVLRDIYGDPVEQTMTDENLRNRLISDDAFSIRVAAGYLRMLQNAGLTGEWPQFMAYSQSVEQAVAWKAAGHPMDPATLARIGFIDEGGDEFLDFRERQQFYNDSVAAIG